jgi:phage terminase small subunit
LDTYSVGGVMETYKGERVVDLLHEIDRLEKILIQHNKDIDPFSMARYEEYCHAYSVLTIAKAKLRAIKGEKI